MKVFFLTFLFFSNIALAEDIKEKISSSSELSKLTGVCPADIFSGKEVDYVDLQPVCNNNQQSCLNKCIEGSANHCFSLAYTIQKGTIEDVGYTDILFLKACKEGLVTACTNIAAGLMQYAPKNQGGCFKRSFELTCRKGDAWGCTMYGLLLHKGIEVEKNNDEALKVLEVGCKNGIEDSACQYAKSIEKLIEIESEK